MSSSREQIRVLRVWLHMPASTGRMRRLAIATPRRPVEHVAQLPTDQAVAVPVAPLTRAGHDVVHVDQISLVSADDEGILNHAAAEGRVEASSLNDKRIPAAQLSPIDLCYCNR